MIKNHYHLPKLKSEKNGEPNSKKSATNSKRNSNNSLNREIKSIILPSQIRVPNEELTNIQKETVHLIANKLLGLGIIEYRYFLLILKEKLLKKSGVSLLKMSVNWSQVEKDANGMYPPINPNWFKQQEMMSKFGHLLGGLSGIGSAESSAESNEKKVEKPGI